MELLFESVFGLFVGNSVRRLCCCYPAREPRTRGTLIGGGWCVVLFQFTVQGGLADSQESCGGQLVSAGLAQRTENSSPLQFFKRQQLVGLGQLFGGGIVEIGR